MQAEASTVPKQFHADFPRTQEKAGLAHTNSHRDRKVLDAAAGLKAFNLADTAAGRREMAERLDKRAVSEEIKSRGVPPQTEEVDHRARQLRRCASWGRETGKGCNWLTK
jgi:hypothetical protein